jgi:hypothetical protein
LSSGQSPAQQSSPQRPNANQPWGDYHIPYPGLNSSIAQALGLPGGGECEFGACEDGGMGFTQNNGPDSNGVYGQCNDAGLCIVQCTGGGICVYTGAARINLNWIKIGIALGCLAGMDPEYAKPITGVPNEPRGSTDAPDGMKNGNNQKTINGPNKNGRKVLTCPLFLIHS